MPDYALSCSGKNGWRNVRVLGADSMAEAIRLAEQATGCMVSHARGSAQPGMDANLTIDAATGEVTHHHDRSVRVEVSLGPPDVLRAIAQSLKAAPKAPPRRKVNRKQPDAEPAA